MEAVKRSGVLFVWICLASMLVLAAVIGLIFRRDSVRHGDYCFDCVDGRFEVMPESDYVSVHTLFGKEQLRCTHCGSENIKGIQW